MGGKLACDVAEGRGNRGSSRFCGSMAESLHIVYIFLCVYMYIYILCMYVYIYIYTLYVIMCIYILYVCMYIYIHIRTFNLLQNSGCWSETCKASKTRCAETRKATFDQEVSWKLALCERKHHVRLRALNMFIQIDICIYIYTYI
jgi:small-conductance mechanosensitive channel